MRIGFLLEPHANFVCKKASQKLHALFRVSKFISKWKTRVIMKAFIMSQFSYCPLVWYACAIAEH